VLIFVDAKSMPDFYLVFFLRAQLLNSPHVQCAGLYRLSFMGWLNCGIGLFDEARGLKHGRLLTAASCPSGVDAVVHLFLVDMSSSEHELVQLRSCSIAIHNA
jgi:hypothetical protein